jgi:hypothetical protein
MKTSQVTTVSLLNNWQSDAYVILCGRLLMLSKRLTDASTLLRKNIRAACDDLPQPSPESLETSDTTLVVPYSK